MAPEPEPSATVVLLRDAARRPELLLLQRAPRKDGRPGPWVFPGGKVEPNERDAHDDPKDAALRAAVRETHEEAGLRVAPTGLVTISRWITPEISPRRFDTWFFLGVESGREAVRVDGSEIVDHRWLDAQATLRAHEAGEIRLAPPTFVTVTWLLGYASAGDAHAGLATADPLVFRPRICPGEAGATMLYPGDAGYDAGDPQAPGPRHRLHAVGREYRYERSDLG